MVDKLNSHEEYFKKLDHWVRQTKLLQNAAASFPYYLVSNYPNFFALDGNNLKLESDEIKSASGTQKVENSSLNNLVSNRVSEQVSGYEFVIAPLWKRFVAEMVDVALLLLLKVAITFTLLNVFNLDLSYEFDSVNMKNSRSEDESTLFTLSDLLTLSSDLVALEILMKIFVCLYEAFWTMNGRVFAGGATPGKLLLRLRIVYVEVLSVANREGLSNPTGNPLRALIYPAANPGFRRAFLRAVAKNLVLALLFPICFVFLFLKNNRTFYDVLTKTIVVEENQSPTIRREI